MSRSLSFQSILDKVLGNSTKTHKREPISLRKRQLRLEHLENRELLAVTVAEFDAIRDQYKNANLAEMDDYNIIEIRADELTQTKLQNVIQEAGSTTEHDLIVVRTTDSQKTLTLSSQVDIKASTASKGPNMNGITFVALGDGNLTIDASSNRAFMIDGVDVSFVGVNIVNARVVAKSTTATTLTDVSTAGHGGAIYNKNGDLTIAYSTLSNNWVQGNYGSGGAIFSWGGSLTITDSTLSGNQSLPTTATYMGRGGAIYIVNGDLVVSDSTVKSNSAKLGGGIAAGGNGSILIDHSSIDYNNAATSGGGLYVDGGTASMTNTVTISGGSSIMFNTSKSHGAGIYVEEETNEKRILSVTSTDIAYNEAMSSSTSSTANGGGVFYNGNKATFTGVRVVGNIAGNGAGIYLGTKANTTTIDKSLICENKAFTRGGGILDASTATTSSLMIGDTEILDNEAVGSTGGGLASNVMFTLTNVTVAGNTAQGNGGGIQTTDKSKIIDSIVSNNISTGSGGGLYSSTTAEIIGSKFDDNQAKTSGGGAYIGTTSQISSSFFRGNGVVATTGKGGGLYVGAKSVLTNSVVAGNYSGGDGGGLYGIFDKITNATVVGNIAGKGGGGLYAPSATTTQLTTLQNSIFAYNRADGTTGGHDIRTVTANRVNVSYSLVHNQSAGTGKGFANAGNNLAAGTSPLFVNMSGLASGAWSQSTWKSWGTLELQDTSLARDRGNNAAITETTDVRGEGYKRVVGSLVDFGAYEYGNLGPYATPTNVAATVVDNTHDVRVTWTEGDASTYRVTRTGPDGRKVFEVTGNEFLDTGLASGKYIYQVVAIGDRPDSQAGVSNEVRIGEVLGELNPQAKQFGTDVQISWNDIPGAVYEIRRGDTVLTTSATGTSYIDQNVPEGEYTYSVRAVVGSDIGKWEDVTIHIAPPIGPVVTVSKPDADTVKLSWNAVPDASHYNVYRVSENGEKIQPALATGLTDLTWSETDLEPGTYFYIVSAVVNDEEQDSMIAIAQIDAAPIHLDTPNVTAIVNGKNVVVSWGAINNATHYLIERRVDGGEWMNLSSAFVGTSYTDISALEGNIEYRVQAIGTGGLSGKGGASAFLDLPPAAPEITLSTNANDYVVVSWDAVDTATHYDVRRRAIGGEWVTLTDNFDGTSFVDPTAPEGLFEYAVRAYEGELVSAFFPRSIEVDLPPAVPNVTLTANPNESVTLTWDAVASATHYSIQRRVNGGEWEEMIGDVEGNSYIDVGVAEGNIEYRVRAHDATKSSSTITKAIFTDWAPDAPVFDLVAEDNGNVVISWNAVDTATSYDVRRRVNGGAWVIVTSEFTGTSYTDMNAPEGQVEYFVRAYENTLVSDFETENILVVRPPAAPVVSLAIQSDETVKLSWESVPGADSYRIERRDAGGNWITLDVTAGNAYIDTTAPEGNIEYAVYALKGTLESTFLGKSIFVDWAPDAPNVYEFVADANGNVTLEWNAVDTAIYYDVRRRVDGGDWVVVTDHFTGTSFTDTNAPEGTVEYSVRAFETTLVSDFNSVQVEVVKAPAAPAVALNVLQESRQVQVSWTAVVGATYYSVQRRAVGGEWVTVAENTGSTQFLDSDAPEGNVEYAVIAHKGELASTPSSQGVFLNWPPAAPVVSAAAQPDGQVVLSWADVPSATSYDVMRRTVGGEWTVVTDQWNGTEFIDRYAPEGDVQYAVVANEGSLASERGFVTISVDYPPAAPVVSATVQEDNSVIVAWENDPAVTSYAIMRNINGTWATIAENVTGNQFIDTTAPSGEVQYAVRAYKGIAVSDSSVVTVNVSNAPVFTLTPNADGTVTVNWGAVDGMSEYGVFRRVPGTGDYGWEVIDYTSGTSLIDHTVTPGQYEYAVIGYGGMAETEYNIVSVTVPEVSALTATVNGDGTVSLDWTPVSGTNVKYNVIRVSDNGQETIVRGLTATDFTDTTVTEGTYTYIVRAMSGLSTLQSLVSDTVTVAPVADPLPPFGPPTLAGTYNSETGKVELAWNAVAEAVRYSVWYNNNGTWTRLNNNAGGTSIAVDSPLTGNVEFQIRAHNADNVAKRSNNVMVAISTDTIGTPDPLPPFGPPTLTATYNSATGKVELSWNAVADAVRYSIMFNDGSGTFVNVNNKVTATHWEFDPQVTGVVKFFVRAHNAAGEFERSKQVTVTVDALNALSIAFGNYDPYEELLVV